MERASIRICFIRIVFQEWHQLWQSAESGGFASHPLARFAKPAADFAVVPAKIAGRASSLTQIFTALSPFEPLSTGVFTRYISMEMFHISADKNSIGLHVVHRRMRPHDGSFNRVRRWQTDAHKNTVHLGSSIRRLLQARTARTPLRPN
jgi:hypothetical protein